MRIHKDFEPRANLMLRVGYSRKKLCWQSAVWVMKCSLMQDSRGSTPSKQNVFICFQFNGTSRLANSRRVGRPAWQILFKKKSRDVTDFEINDLGFFSSFSLTSCQKGQILEAPPCSFTQLLSRFYLDKLG